MSRNLIVVDLETTGLGPQCAPIEVAAINVDTGEVLEFVPYVDLTKVDVEPQAFAINRYFERGVFHKMLNPDDTDDMWAKLARLLRDNTFAGSNPTFDAALVTREIAKPTWHHRKADLAAYAAPALGRDPSELPGLHDVLTLLNVENRCPHSALGDAEATAKAFVKLRERYADMREFYVDTRLGTRGGAR
ncbi:exonuclease domain-containing protein [Mycobacterium sp. D16Q16]|uniref:3'-5' exonuclease n=1 Tax=Mycobacterium sp. D16Q16 TaxID=1855659 RepID=UPI0009927B92|nr:exonuclease domain-containing protein [Mycobacterium sp. D16Q16]